MWKILYFIVFVLWLLDFVGLVYLLEWLVLVMMGGRGGVVCDSVLDVVFVKIFVLFLLV